MSGPTHHEPPHGNGEPRTLGDLLRAGGGDAVPEDAWLALVQAIARGDQSAMHTLYERAHRLVFTLMVRITGNRHTADELTVDVFFDVWRRAPQYDPAGGSVIGWITSQARCRAIDRLRFEQRKKRTLDPGASPPPVPAAGEPGEALAAQERARLLREAMVELTPDERQAIETAFFGQLAYPEVAARLRQPLGTIKTRIRSGLTRLRDALGAKEESL